MPARRELGYRRSRNIGLVIPPPQPTGGQLDFSKAVNSALLLLLEDI
jgi:hypothetical protein